MARHSTKINPNMADYDYWQRPVATEPKEKIWILAKALQDIYRLSHHEAPERFIAKAALLLTGEKIDEHPTL
jgi:hypothetical protein